MQTLSIRIKNTKSNLEFYQKLYNDKNQMKEYVKLFNLDFQFYKESIEEKIKNLNQTLIWLENQ